MSDTARAAPPEPRRRCCRRLALLLLLAAALAVGYLVWVASSILADAPLDIPGLELDRSLEDELLEAKLQLKELPGRLLGGATEVSLDERELNLLVLGRRPLPEGTRARLLLSGETLTVETSTRLERPAGKFLNLRVEVQPDVGPGSLRVRVVSGQIGSWTLGPLWRGLVARQLDERLAWLRDNDPRLGRIKALWVEQERVRLVYDAARE